MILGCRPIYRFAGTDSIRVISIADTVTAMRNCSQPSSILPGELVGVSVGEWGYYKGKEISPLTKTVSGDMMLSQSLPLISLFKFMKCILTVKDFFYFLNPIFRFNLKIRITNNKIRIFKTVISHFDNVQ